MSKLTVVDGVITSNSFLPPVFKIFDTVNVLLTLLLILKLGILLSIAIE